MHRFKGHELICIQASKISRKHWWTPASSSGLPAVINYCGIFPSGEYVTVRKGRISLTEVEESVFFVGIVGMSVG